MRVGGNSYVQELEVVPTSAPAEDARSGLGPPLWGGLAAVFLVVAGVCVLVVLRRGKGLL